MIRGLAFSLLLIVACTYTVFAQSEAPKGWHLLDSAKDSFYGISLNKAYQFLQAKNKNPQTVIVAVLDSGVDTTHEDLKKISGATQKRFPATALTMIKTDISMIYTDGISWVEKTAEVLRKQQMKKPGYTIAGKTSSPEKR